MSETLPRDESQALEQAIATTALLTAGQRLRAARLQAGVDLHVLSVKLKVPVQKLEALEADQHPNDQSPVFARSLAASVCRQLGVDPLPILALLPSAANYIEPHGSVRHCLVAPRALVTSQRPSAALARHTGWLAVAMLGLIAALIWLPSPAQWAWVQALSVQWSAGPKTDHMVTAEPAVLPAEPAASDALPLGATVVVPSQVDASAPAPVVQVPMAAPAQPLVAAPDRGARFEVKP
jgi:cytoskeleton protein RodZ